jgi:hypothetical protein
MEFFKRTVTATVLILLVVATITLVVLSPWGLRILAGARGMNWPELSNIGQSYSAAAALLSALALIGVALSLLAQNRDSRVALEQAIRSQHRDLVRMGFDSPLMWVISGSRGLRSEDPELRALQRRYANLWVQHWASMYELGVMSETAVRTELRRSLFSGDVGRDYWANTSASSYYNGTRRVRRYYKIVNDEYNKAVSAGPPEKINPKSIRSSAGPKASSLAPSASIIGLSAAADAALATILIRKLADKS